MFIKSSEQAIRKAFDLTNQNYDNNLILQECILIKDLPLRDRELIHNHLYSIMGNEANNYYQVGLWVKDIYGKGAETGNTGRHFATTCNMATHKFIDNLQLIEPNMKIM